MPVLSALVSVTFSIPIRFFPVMFTKSPVTPNFGLTPLTSASFPLTNMFFPLIPIASLGSYKIHQAEKTYIVQYFFEKILAFNLKKN